MSISHFNSKVYVDLREYYEKDDEMLPGKKGIMLTPEQWTELKKVVSEVDQELVSCSGAKTTKKVKKCE